jgi:hypothetical protein
MSTIELRTHLHELVDVIADAPVLQEMFQLLTTGKSISKDWFEQLPESTKVRVLESMEQADSNWVSDHNTTMQQFAEKFPQLRVI